MCRHFLGQRCSNVLTSDTRIWAWYILHNQRKPVSSISSSLIRIHFFEMKSSNCFSPSNIQLPRKSPAPTQCSQGQTASDILPGACFWIPWEGENREEFTQFTPQKKMVISSHQDLRVFCFLWKKDTPKIKRVTLKQNISKKYIKYFCWTIESLLRHQNRKRTGS